jgi:hypothetical protein
MSCQRDTSIEASWKSQCGRFKWLQGKAASRAKSYGSPRSEAFAYLVGELLKRIEADGDTNLKRETSETRKVWEERIGDHRGRGTFA